MTTILRTITTTLGLAVFAAAFAPVANAGCAEVGPNPATSPGRNSGAYLMQAAYRPAWFAPVADNNFEGAAIVGMWRVRLLAGGDVFDFGYQQWHAMQQVREFEELDLHLLASDLPIDAYLDGGFQNWLRTTFDY